MSTISDIASTVCEDYLKRDDCFDLATKQAWKVYRLICAKVPFDQLSTTSAERPVTTSSSIYDLSDLDPALAGIVSIRMTYGTNRQRRLTRSHVRLFDQMNPGIAQEPALYARWGSSIEFNCLPRLSSYTYRVRYWSLPTPAPDWGDTVLLSPPEWDELFEWETLYRMYVALDQHEKAAMLTMPSALPRQASPKRTPMLENGIIPRLWNELLQTVSQRENSDEEFSMNPVSRRYTAG